MEEIQQNNPEERCKSSSLLLRMSYPEDLKMLFPMGFLHLLQEPHPQTLVFPAIPKKPLSVFFGVTISRFLEPQQEYQLQKSKSSFKKTDVRIGFDSKKHAVHDLK